MIYLAPLQSYTNLFYIQAFSKYVLNVDKYFTPFYRPSNNGAYSIDNELHPSSNVKLIPQVLCNSSGNLVEFANEMSIRNFDEININMGCPFPMVVNKQLGSGLLPHPDSVKLMLDGYFEKGIALKLSLKLRLGKDDNSELEKLTPIFKQYPISEVIIHPRLGVQKYKGVPNWDIFSQLKNEFNCPVIGNGDINSYLELSAMREKYDWANGWMLGRGLLKNPFLLENIDYNSKVYWEKLIGFHQVFLNGIKHLNDVQQLNLLKVFWEYPLGGTTENNRLHRKLKKIGVYNNYQDWLKLLHQHIGE